MITTMSFIPALGGARNIEKLKKSNRDGNAWEWSGGVRMSKRRKDQAESG